MDEKVLYILFVTIVMSQAKDKELPLCPTDIQYFPQNIPMHCRLPNGAEFASLSNMKHVATAVPPNIPMMSYQSPPPDKQPNPVPIPFPAGLPGPMGIPMPGMMPLPGPVPNPAQKLPVIVMPFYAPDPSYKRPEQQKPQPPRRGRRPKKRRQRPIYSDDSDTDTDTDDTDSSDTDTSSDTSTGRDYWKGVKKGWKKNARNSRRSFRRKKIKKNLLTPVLQYVTKDGYVIFERTISKGEASDWLNVKKKTEEGKKIDKDDVEPHNHDEDHEQHIHDDDHEQHIHDDDHEHDDHDYENERKPVEKQKPSAVLNKKLQHYHPTRPVIKRNPTEQSKGKIS